MGVPGVGPLIALRFVAVVDRPTDCGIADGPSNLRHCERA
jgi:hypothetical protein